MDLKARYAVVSMAAVGVGVVAVGATSAIASAPPHNSALGAQPESAIGSTSTDLQSRILPPRASRQLARTAAPKPAPDWIRPAIGPMSSGFGPRWGTFHYGLDIAVPTGTKVHAAHAGVVVKAGWYGGYGNVVIIDHGNGVTTRYGHNSKVVVTVGQKVAAGDLIALSGSTGDSTGPHCHFEVRIDDVAVDPLPYMRARGIDLAQNINTSL
jgi:murein DD-endopeptidase MepM/ murein hydrolase activator NlpD